MCRWPSHCPGHRGRLVVFRGMLRCLGDREREALLAHERAYLRGRHHVFQSVWRLTSALNPLLRPVAVAGDFVLERWADEEAAERVGDRTVVAHAVGRAALASASFSPLLSQGAGQSAPDTSPMRLDLEGCRSSLGILPAGPRPAPLGRRPNGSEVGLPLSLRLG
ncbi:M48 family metalloprotease [Streptomyces griseofuscus]|uniref:M48 family metalloprotease n=1 Tax=Streptomyces griseofuscus TaxID=146922 RepID=UPI00319DE439